MLTKKHFEAIADAMRAARPTPGTAAEAEAQWLTDLTHLCEALRKINPRFDKDRFMDWVQFGGSKIAKK